MVMQMLAPYAVDVAGIVIKEAFAAHVQARRNSPEGQDAGVDVSDGAVPSVRAQAVDRHCPYCATAKHLAAAHMYLVRSASVSPDLQAVYQKLVAGEVRDALAEIDGIPGTPDPETMRLGVTIGRLDLLSSRPLTEAEAQVVARETWNAISAALLLAERYNAAAPSAEQRIAELESRLVELEGRQPGALARDRDGSGVVIEGEVVSRS